MSVSLIIVLLLIIAYRAGARRGLVQTIVNVVGYVAVAFAAGYLAHEYGPCFAEKCLRLLMKEMVFSSCRD